MTTDELLQRYAADRSEMAFAELVRQHIDLVYSSALRQLNGDTGAAQDVTQAVFTALAGQARKLTRHTSLTGWLYTTTRNLAAKARRTEQRRRAREQEAHAMNQVLQSTDPDPAWQEMRPLLDEAMHDLTTADREALLMRYFERLPLGQVGERLGLAENAARMKVDRALTKLRAALAKRGITSTSLALAATLAERAVMAAPMGLAAQVSHAALVALAAQGGAGLIQLLATTKAKLLLAAGAAVLVASLLVVLPAQFKNSPSPMKAAKIDAVPEAAGASVAATEALPTVNATAMRNARSAGTTGKLLLKLVSAESGQPIPLATIEFVAPTGARGTAPRSRGSPPRMIPPTSVTATRLGVCEIPVPPGARSLTIRTKTDGFVDTSITWSVDRGEIVPEEYMLRLPRAITIGGWVLDENGRPIAGAEVFMSVFGNPDPTTSVVPHLSINAGEKVSTDASGRWRIDRFSSESLDTGMSSMANHPDFVTNGPVQIADGTPLKMKQRLLAGQYVFTLKRGVALRGLAMDSDGHAVPGALVVVSSIKTTIPAVPAKATTKEDGTFMVFGCESGTNQVLVEAPGMARTNLLVNLVDNTPALRITLALGRLMRLRTVDQEGRPLAGVLIKLKSGSDQLPTWERTDLSWRTDDEGRYQWGSAPDRDLTVSLSKTGYITTEAVLKPDATEHLVTLPTSPPSGSLTIWGTVNDATTGQPVTNFSITTGTFRGAPGASTNFSWSTTKSFRDGQFRAVESIPNNRRGGPLNTFESIPSNIRGWQFKFQADGYAAFVTRQVSRSEGQAQFEIKLQPVVITSVTVLLPEGRPAAKVDVAFKTAGNRLALLPGGFARTPPSRAYIVSTDEAGRFALPSDETILTVLAAHARGFAESTPATLVADQTMHLKPWGRLEGLFSVGGKPASGRRLTIRTRPRGQDSFTFQLDAFRAESDAEGRFIFPQVPPGSFELMRLVSLPDLAAEALLRLTVVEIRPEETTKVTVSTNQTVIARLRWPAGLQHEPGWQINNAYLRTLLPAPPVGTSGDPEAFAGLSVLSLRENAEGMLSAEEVPPGSYQLHLIVGEPSPNGGSFKVTAAAHVTVIVPANASGTVDLGEIELQPEK